MSYRLRRYPQVDSSHLPQDLPELIQQIYARRHIKHADELDLTVTRLPHFSALKHTSTAATLLADAIVQQQHICICGDFDADGATSTALMVSALRAFGALRVSYLVPNRFADGYGLSPSVVAQAVENDVNVIVTVDNGIACHAGVDAAKNAGLKVVVTDHHLPGENLPQADVVVNPNQLDCHFPSKHIAGVGVAFYVLLALRHELRERQHSTIPNLADWLDLVAVGTVADVVSLDPINRILVEQGCRRIRAGHCRVGIQALIDVAGRDSKQLQATDLGFAVGPRINAAGRLDDMALGIECLLSSEPQSAHQMAQELDRLNKERRSIEADMRSQAEAAVAQIQLSGSLPPLLTLHEADWHQGVIGIVAGRVKEQVHRPVIAFAHDDDSYLKGSARSIPGVHMRDLLARIDSLDDTLIERFGGHAMAAGLTLKIEQLPRFQELALRVATEMIGEQELAHEVWSDGELSAVQLNEATIHALQAAGPWGQGFPEPLFDGKFRLVQQRIVGEKHLKMVVQHSDNLTFDAIAFNIDTGVWPDLECQTIELVYRPQLNHFRGRTSVQLLVEHFRALR